MTECTDGLTHQSRLTKNPPMILDATASFFHHWPKHATIRMDIRHIVKPDIVADICKTPFPNKFFDEIYIDPPHMIRKDPMILPRDFMTLRRRLSGRRSPNAFSRYGFFKSKEEWYSFLDKANIELMRILKINGKIHWKLTFSTHDRRYIKREDMNRLTNFKTVKERITKSKKPGSKNMVHWLTMDRITQE